MNMRCCRSFFISFLTGLALYAAATLPGCPLLLADETEVLTVRTTDGNLYAQPVKIAEVIEKLSKGMQVLALHQKGEWYAVSLTDQRLGWAHQSIFAREESTTEIETTTEIKVVSEIETATETEKTAEFEATAPVETVLETETAEVSPPTQAGRSAVLKVNSGRVRSAPSLNAEIEFGLARHDPFKVLAEEGDWYQIMTESGRTGWIYHTLIQFLPHPQPSETREDSAPPVTENVAVKAENPPPETEKNPAPGEEQLTVVLRVSSGRVRTAPSKASSTAFTITRGTRATVTKTEAGWYHILLPDGRTGWSYMKLYDIVSGNGGNAPEVRTEADAGTEASASEKEIKTIRFESTPDGDETIIFVLNSFNPPHTFTVEDKQMPMVVCEFAETRLAPEIGSIIPVDGKLVTALSIRKPGGRHSPVRVEATLDPRFKYSVEQVFFKKSNVYVMNFKK